MKSHILFATAAFLSLSACSLSQKVAPQATPVRPITQQELVSFYQPGFQLMPRKADTPNVFHANVDADSDEEVLMILNSTSGCATTDRARLLMLKYDHQKDAWYLANTLILAGKQGRIESFQKAPTDVTGDGVPDVEIISETNGCGGPWTVYKQLLNYKNGEVVDLTGGLISSLDGGLTSIVLSDKKYEIYTRVGAEGTCSPYSLTTYDFDGQKFVQGQTVTTKYKYKTQFDLSGATAPDTFNDGCIMTFNDNAKKLRYIRDDAVNHVYADVVPKV